MFEIKLDIQEVNLILQALSEMPIKIALPTLSKVEAQAKAQHEAIEQAKAVAAE